MSIPRHRKLIVRDPLEILFEIQEWFKKITGLPGVTTQPVAGAQGELVGLKLFQAYHRSNSRFRQEMSYLFHGPLTEPTLQLQRWLDLPIRMVLSTSSK